MAMVKSVMSNDPLCLVSANDLHAWKKRVERSLEYDNYQLSGIWALHRWNDLPNLAQLVNRKLGLQEDFASLVTVEEAIVGSTCHEHAAVFGPIITGNSWL